MRPCFIQGSSTKESEFAWTVLCQTTTQKSVRKLNTNWTDRHSEEQECFSCAVVRCGDVECAKQDVVSLSAIQPEPYTWNTGGARTSHTNCLDRSHRPTDDQDGNDDRGGLGWRIVAEDFLEGHSWTTGVVLHITIGVGLLSCMCCIQSAPANGKCRCDPEVARQPRGVILRSM